MADGSYLAQLLAAFFFMLIGIRLLVLGRRTGETPEKLLGFYFLLTGLSYVGWLIPPIFRIEDSAAVPLDLLAWSLYSVGVVPFAIFTRTTFRPQATWAVWIVASCTLLLFAGMTAWIRQGQDYYDPSSLWFWCEWLGYTVPCIWMSGEAFLAYSAANRRVRIGLCDRVVANRYLLFGLFGVFQTFACFVDIFTAMEIMTGEGISARLDLVLGTSELLGIAMLFLIFFPPAFYRHWLDAPAADTLGELES